MAEFNETLEVAVNDGLSVSFYKGLRANLPVVGVDGVYYQCTDTGELFLGTGTGMKQVTKEIDLTNYATKEDLQNVPHAETATDLTGRVEATPEVFTYRPSAGNKSIKDDNAFIRRIKGNSIVWNQFIAQYNRTSNGVTISFDEGVYSLSGTAPEGYFQMGYITDIPKGHLFLIFCDVLANPNNISFMFGDLNNSGSYFDPAQSNYFIYTIAEGTLANHAIGFQSFPAGTDFTGVKIACNIHDLTSMFGAGNEPTTEEFRMLFPNGHYAYNTGELRNLMCSGIKTVGFNEFNGTYARVLPNESYYLSGTYTSIGFATEIGGATESISIPSNKLYTPTQLGYIYATGTDICINLHHTGYRDGEYEPYKEVTHELPLSEITNGQPLRKAGDVYDEINETEYIKRVGVVDLGSLNWKLWAHNIFNCEIQNFAFTTTDSARLNGLFCSKYTIDTKTDVGPAMTDKTMKRHQGVLRIRDTSFADAASFKAALSGILLHYELAEPIIKPIETPLVLGYYVEDFGTEEAMLAENSAPFSADIIYQFNAVDRIRQNDLNIDRLEDKIYNLDQSIKDKAEKAEYFPISLESLYAVAEGETVAADKYTIIQMLYRQQTGINDLLLQNDEGLTVGYVVGGVVGDSLQFSAYTNDGKLIKVVASESEDELTESDVEVFDLLSSGEPNSQLAYAEYTGTATTAVVTTKYGYFPTTLVEGASVAVKFEGSLTYITTLNVNGTGAKNVYYKGNSLASGTISRYNTYIFVYDGSYYRIVGIDTDTHYTAKNVVTSSSTSKSNATATNGNVYLNAVENSTVRSTHKIVGTGATTVTSDASGNITIDTPIKTINGESIVGSGNIVISGGGSSSGSSAYAEVSHGTSDTTFTLTPNVFHIWDEVTELNVILGSETSGVANEYLFQFTSGATTTLTLPDDIKWANGEAPVIEANKIYQISILKGLGSVMSWKVELSIVFPITLEMGDNGDIGISLYSYLQSTYGEPTSGTTLNEEIINNYNGVTFETIEYATYVGFTGYWLNGYAPYMMSWVLLEDGYLQRVIPSQEN